MNACEDQTEPLGEAPEVDRPAVKLPAEFDKPTGIAALLRHHGVRVEFVEPAADDEMTATDQPTTLRQWLPRLLAGQPHQVIGGLDDPYLRRWYVIPRNPWLNVYIHQFLRSDDPRALHDHPWWFISLMLRGEYVEIVERGWKSRRAGSVAFRPAQWRHRVQLVPNPAVHVDSVGWVSDGREVPCWTLIITGRRSRTWGFWCRHLIDAWSARTPGERDKVTASDTGQVEVERFVPWDEFGDAGCGER